MIIKSDSIKNVIPIAPRHVGMYNSAFCFVLKIHEHKVRHSNSDIFRKISEIFSCLLRT